MIYVSRLTLVFFPLNIVDHFQIQTSVKRVNVFSVDKVHAYLGQNVRHFSLYNNHSSIHTIKSHTRRFHAPYVILTNHRKYTRELMRHHTSFVLGDDASSWSSLPFAVHKCETADQMRVVHVYIVINIYTVLRRRNVGIFITLVYWHINRSSHTNHTHHNQTTLQQQQHPHYNTIRNRQIQMRHHVCTYCIWL